MLVAKKEMHYMEQPYKKESIERDAQQTREVKEVSTMNLLHQQVVPVLFVGILFVLALVLIVRYVEITNVQQQINSAHQQMEKQDILAKQLELQLSRSYDVRHEERSIVIDKNAEVLNPGIKYVDVSAPSEAKSIKKEK